MGPIAQLNIHGGPPTQRALIKWIDETSQGKVPLGHEGDPEIDICIKLMRNEAPPLVNTHRRIHAKSLRTSMKVALDTNQISKLYPSLYHKQQQEMMQR